MGDAAPKENSMEEILASIRRIIDPSDKSKEERATNVEPPDLSQSFASASSPPASPNDVVENGAAPDPERSSSPPRDSLADVAARLRAEKAQSQTETPIPEASEYSQNTGNGPAGPQSLAALASRLRSAGMVEGGSSRPVSDPGSRLAAGTQVIEEDADQEETGTVGELTASPDNKLQGNADRPSSLAELARSLIAKTSISNTHKAPFDEHAMGGETEQGDEFDRYAQADDSPSDNEANASVSDAEVLAMEEALVALEPVGSVTQVKAPEPIVSQATEPLSTISPDTEPVSQAKEIAESEAVALSSRDELDAVNLELSDREEEEKAKEAKQERAQAGVYLKEPVGSAEVEPSEEPAASKSLGEKDEPASAKLDHGSQNSSQDVSSGAAEQPVDKKPVDPAHTGKVRAKETEVPTSQAQSKSKRNTTIVAKPKRVSKPKSTPEPKKRVSKDMTEQASKSSRDEPIDTALEDVSEAVRDALVSPNTRSSVAASMSKLRQTVVEQELAKSEAITRSLIKEWLDKNLPSIVERMVQEEITKITSNGMAPPEKPVPGVKKTAAKPAAKPATRRKRKTT